MKKLLITALVVTMAAGVYAQSTFFPTKAGTVMTYVQKDAKGKVDSYSRSTIKKIEGSGKNITILYVVESLDKNRKSSNPPNEMSCKVIVKNNVMTLDMNQMFAGQSKDQNIQMEVTGIPMELPSNMNPGQSLKDAEMTMTIDMVFTKMQTVIKMTDGKCLAIEDVTVPAGTFKCHKITQTVTTTVMKTKTVATTISWYATGIGAVKTETYDAKKKLLGSTELVEFKN
jgi:hypothetical protein